MCLVQLCNQYFFKTKTLISRPRPRL